MIVRPRPRGIEYFFLLRGSVLPNIWQKLTITIVTALAVTFNHGVLYHLKITLTPTPFTLMGLALAIFLGFRNSASYDRFWEGRKLWGSLTNASRNLARRRFSASVPRMADLGRPPLRKVCHRNPEPLPFSSARWQTS